MIKNLMLMTILALVAGCSSDAEFHHVADGALAPEGGSFVDSSPEAGPDAGPDAPAQASPDADTGSPGDATGCTPLRGDLACYDLLDALCARTVQCCLLQPCPPWATGMGSCRAEHLINGPRDCPQLPYATGSACSQDVNRCVGDLPHVWCDEVLDVPQWPASCLVVWQQLEG